MIMTRSPLRITLGGGGTDLPSYYRKHGGFLISAAIDKYVFITLHEVFNSDLIIKYSQLERVSDIQEVNHPLVREALKLVCPDNPHVEITSMADIPAGTGLGSSGSFLTALLKALHVYKKNIVSPAELAAQACEIEMERLKEPVGKQDQYISAIGGITCFTFRSDDGVDIEPLRLPQETLHDLEDCIMLYFTGYSRSASSILKDQDQKSKVDDAAMAENLHFVKDLGQKSKNFLESGDLRGFAELLNVHWQHKKRRSGGMSNPQIDSWYEHALKNGAIGGKLIGAGGGGFLMFYTEQKNVLRDAMRSTGLREVRVRFDFEGTKVVVV